MKTLVAWLALAWPALAGAAEPVLEETVLRRHIATLASDRFEGRAPGTRGEALTVDYLIDAYRGMGLEPGAPGGGWIQKVELVSRITRNEAARWHAGGTEIAIDPALQRFVGRAPRLDMRDAPLVFLGQGQTLDGAPLRGALALMLASAPDFEARRMAAMRHGAIGVIALHAADAPWPVIRGRIGGGRLARDIGPETMVEGALAHGAWIALVGEALSDAAGAADFRPVKLEARLDLALTTDIRRFLSANVIGKRPGASRPEEAALLMAHWDHLGICRPASAADRICNGAVDNASGIALMLEVARRLGPLPRSLYAVATTAEEHGLLGARAFAEAPPLPLERIAGAINLDTVAIMPAGAPVATLGRGLTPLDPLIEAAVRAQGRILDPDTEANALMQRQDGWALAEKGVPTVMVGGAFSDMKALGAFLAGDYHGPGDEVDKLPPLSGMAEDGALQVALVRMIADPEIFPLPPAKPR